MEDNNIIPKILNMYCNKQENNISWMEKYEFFKPKDCFGFYYIGETCSVRLLHRAKKKTPISNEDTSPKIKPKTFNNYISRKNKREIYGTITLKNLFDEKIRIEQKQKIQKNKCQDKMANALISKKISQITTIAESLLPVNPEQQLKSLHDQFLLDQSSYNENDRIHIESIREQLIEKITHYFPENNWEEHQQTFNFVYYNKHFDIIIEENKLEVRKNYYKSLIHAFLDWVSLDPENRTALQITSNVTPIPIFTIRAPVSCHQNVLNGKNFMRHNLFIGYSIIIKLKQLWFDKYEDACIIRISDLKQMKFPLELSDLENEINEICLRSRESLLQKWLPECSDLLNTFQSSWNILSHYNQSVLSLQTQKFFETVYALMSSQLRRFIANSLDCLLNFFHLYENGNHMKAMYKDYMFLSRPFLTINLKSTREYPFIKFSPSFEELNLTIQNLFKKIIAISENIPRVETYLFPEINIQKEMLLPVRVTEYQIQKTIKNVLECCTANTFGPSKYIKVYHSYFHIFSEEAERDIQTIINCKPVSQLKVFIEKIEHYNLLRKTVGDLRCNVPLNLINLKCEKINNEIGQRINSICSMITNFILNESKIHNERIILSFEEISKRAGETPATTIELVELNNFINKSKTITIVNLKKTLLKSAEYLQFLMEHAAVPAGFILTEYIISLNTKIFRWPKQLEQILEFAASRIVHKIEAAENALKQNKIEFDVELIERSKQLEIIKKKDPPLLTLNEMKDTVSFIEQLILMLEKDKIQAEGINVEEELLNCGVTSYQHLYNMIIDLEPFSNLWHVVLNFHVLYDEWCNNPFIRLNAEEVKTTVEEMKDSLEKLSKIFQDVASAKRMVEIVLKKVEKFFLDIPILQTICNPGLQERHWKKIDEVIGVEIKRTPETTFDEILNHELNKHVNYLIEINIAATEEYTLEQTLMKMKTEWNDIFICYKNYRDTDMQILTGTDDIQVLLDDYLLRIQAMRGSPYVSPIESDIEVWEHKLITMQDILDLWLQVQNTWLYLEPLFNSEDIMRQMPEESENFNNVNKIRNDIMNYVIENSRIFAVIDYPNMIETLKKCHLILESIKKGLNNYLEKKRLVFPRFFFLSNRELLEILSESTDFSNVESHLKCFEGISSLHMTDNFDIMGIISNFGENVPLNAVVSPTDAKGIVERWLDQLEDSMMSSLNEINIKAMRAFSSTSISEWIFQWPAMISYCALYINWTSEVESSLKKCTLQTCREKYEEIYKALINLCHDDLKMKDRCTLSTLILLTGYLLDIVIKLEKYNISDTNNLHWIKQLRYYNEEQNVYVRILNTNLIYGYEYLGDMTRLVITPQTERYYRLMYSATEQFSFVCLMGASGIGKTELCKDFSKAVAKCFCNYRCCGSITHKTISTFLKGCIQMGAWVCFDGIDQMKCEELAIVAEEIQSINVAMKAKKTRFKFNDVEIPLNITCNIMFTTTEIQNFKTKLPNNLQKVVRPVVMSKQDDFCIISKSLESFGFKMSSKISKIILEINQLCNDLLTFRNYYKSNSRTISSILKYLKNVKYTLNDTDEINIVWKAVNLIYGSKFFYKDFKIFEKFCQNLFLQMSPPQFNDTEELVTKIKNLLSSKNFAVEELYVKKLLNLSELVKINQNIILLGQSFTGKTTAYRLLMELSKDGIKTDKFYVISPTSITTEQLYGRPDLESGEWFDGILPRVCRENSNLKFWVVFDGPLDCNWVDRMTTVLDENKKLCLISGEIIPISKNMNIIFETDTLDFVSPSIIHCCAIVSFDKKVIGWRCLLVNFLSIFQQKLSSDHMSILQDVIEWIIPAVLNFLKTNAEQTILLSENYMFHNFTKLTISLLDVQNEECYKNIIFLQLIILVSIVWSFAGSISEESKLLFDTYYRSLLHGQNEKYPKPNKFKLTKSQLFPEEHTVFDFICSKKNSKTWILWTDAVQNNLSSIKEVEDLYVYNNRNAYQIYFFEHLINNQNPILLVGQQGNGKTITLLHYLEKLPTEKYTPCIINMSQYSVANRIQEKIMSKIDRRRKGVYGPAMGKKIIFAFDDFESSANRKHNSPDVVELLRQLLEQKYWYDLHDSHRLELIDFLFVGVVSIPWHSISNFSARFIHHTNIIYSRQLSESNLSNIFTTILDWFFANRGFSTQICHLSQAIVSATLDVYKKAKILATNNKKLPFYFIDYKDVFNVISGIGLMPGHKCQGADEMFRLWVHELMRVFGDKFQSDSDQEDLLNSIKLSSCNHFRQKVDQYTNHFTDKNNQLTYQHLRNLHFGNFISDYNKDYDEITNMSTLINRMNHFVEQYNTTYKIPLPCVFNYAIECITAIVRALQKDKGHVLLIGAVGSARRTTLKIAALITDLTVFENEHVLEYNLETLQHDLKALLFSTGINNKPQLFVISDSQINDEILFDDINTVLNTADLSDIYDAEEKSNILNKMMEIAHEEGFKFDTAPSTLYNAFVKRIKRNMHIAIIMNPSAQFFHNKLHTFPTFLKCCAVYWFVPWPEDSLISIAEQLLRKTSISKNNELLEKCIKFCKSIHHDAIQYTTRFNKTFNAQLNVSPESYIKFLLTFKELHLNKVEKILSKKNRYRQGLEKLNCTANQVTIMQNELQELKPKLLVTSETTEKLMVKIEQNTVNIEAAKEIVAADEALANEAAAAYQAIRDDCESDLSEAEPALLSATNALNTLKCSDITVIKAMKNPPSVVKLVLEAVCIMKGLKPEYRNETPDLEDYWPTSLKLLSDTKFLENLKIYNKENVDENIMNTIRERFIRHPDFNPEVVKKVSNACEGLCKWVRAIEIYDRVIKIVRPKKIKLAQAETDYALQMEKLNKKRTQLSEVFAKLQVLRDELAEKTKQKKELEDSIELCILKLKRAGKLIASLSYEKSRWQKLECELNEDLIRSVGDIFLSSAFIIYLAIFPSNYRNEIMKQWYQLCYDIKLPLSTNYSFSSTFVDSDDIKFWTMAGLPIDPISVDNYIIIVKTIYLPFIIDLHGQSKHFIQYFENKNSLKIIKTSNENYIDLLETSINNGNSILLEDVSENQKDILASLINPITFEDNGIMYFKLREKFIICNKLPKFYFTSSIQKFDSFTEIFNKMTVVNFEMTSEGLESRLLSIIISIDVPDLENKNNSLLNQCTEDNRTLREVEDKILNVLSSTEENILDDETALQTLNNAKCLLEEIRIKRKNSLKEEESLKLAYNPYTIISKQTTRIFFKLSKLLLLNSFYTFSFEWFIALFKQVLRKSNKSNNIQERISFVTLSFASDLYRQLDICLKEEEMLAANFLLSIEMTPGKELLKADMLNFLFANLWQNKNFVSHPSLVTERFRWVIPLCCNLARENEFQLEDTLKDYDLAFFETKLLLTILEENGIIDSALLEFLGTNKFIPVLQNYIQGRFKETENLNSINLYEIYHSVDVKIPIICGFTDIDVDPHMEITNLISEIGLPENIVQYSSLIKSQLPLLFDITLQSMKEGKWVVIQNCHLFKSSVNFLRFLCEKIQNSGEIHPHFRLWIVTSPFKEFPKTILSNGVKIMMKEPKYLNSNLFDLYMYSSRNVQQISEEKKNIKNWNFIFFFLCFCHSIMKMLRINDIFCEKLSCDFTKHNLHINLSYTEIIFSNSTVTLIDELKFLMDECNYSAHFSDVTDQLTLSAIIKSFSVENLDKTSVIWICNNKFEIPDDVSFNGCLRYIQSLPKTNLLEDFKMYQYFTFERSQELINFWKLNRRLFFDIDTEQIRNESHIENVIIDIIATLTLHGIDKRYIPSTKDIMNIYLKQEKTLFYTLIDTIIKSLNNLSKIIFCEFSMSNQWNEIINALKNNEIPSVWNCLSYPSTSSLQHYIINLNQRLIYLNKWIHYGIPEVIWLPGLFNLRGFFTSLLNNFSTYHNISFYETDFKIKVTTTFNVTSLNSKEWTKFYQVKKKENPFGIFIYGLILLGASWKNGKIVMHNESKNECFSLLPIVWIEPTTKVHIIENNIYVCPLYYTNSLYCQSTFLFENFVTNLKLPTVLSSEILTQKGVRLIVAE